MTELYAEFLALIRDRAPVKTGLPKDKSKSGFRPRCRRQSAIYGEQQSRGHRCSPPVHKRKYPRVLGGRFGDRHGVLPDPSFGPRISIRHGARRAQAGIQPGSCSVIWPATLSPKTAAKARGARLQPLSLVKRRTPRWSRMDSNIQFRARLGDGFVGSSELGPIYRRTGRYFVLAGTTAGMPSRLRFACSRTRGASPRFAR